VAPGRALSFLGPSIDNLLVNFQAQKEIRIETPPVTKIDFQSGPYYLAWLPEIHTSATDSIRLSGE
jgi:hypothetical protein